MSGEQYQIKVTNNSSIDHQNAIVFQRPPELPADVHSLAWLSNACHSGTWIEFDWTIDYNFIWGQEGNLKPGVKFTAGQTIDADLDFNNKVTLRYEGGGFKFGPTGLGPINGTGALFVSQGPDVPGYGNSNQGSVGIGMSGQGTFVVPTNPDGGGGTQFSITPTYWVAFGSHEQGMVVTEDILSFPQEVRFPVGAFSADCTFSGTGWTVKFQ